MIGSTLFALASIPVFFSSVPAGLIAFTYFVGSLFFTCAAYLSFLQVVNPMANPFQTSVPSSRTYRLLGWRPREIAWWATGVQLVGTLWFNVSTFSAMGSDLMVGTYQDDDMGTDAGSVYHFEWTGSTWAEQQERVFATVGLHPHEAPKIEDAHVDQARELLKHPKVVAFGETIGLHYRGRADSPIRGPKGNLETFVHFTCGQGA